jgi:hypothetical protein
LWLDRTQGKCQKAVSFGPLTLASAHSRQTVAAIAALAAGVLATLYALVPLQWAAVLIGVLLWFAAPGLIFARRLYGPQPESRLAGLLAGPAWGYVLSSLGLLALWALGSRQFAVLMLAPVFGCLAALPARRLAGTLTLPAFTRGDLGACALVLLVVTLVLGLPYAHVGKDLPEGRAYRAYFTADFVWEVAVVAELAKGDMPPQNPYYLNDDLHYYWLMHLLPAVQHRTFGGTPTADQLLLVNAFWSALAFAAFWYFFVRHFVSSPWAAAIGCVFVLLGTSLEGIDRIWYWNGNFEALRNTNIDAVTDWYYQGMRADGLHRLLLYQPQHQTGYLLGLSAVLLLFQARDISRPSLFLLIGAFLGACMLFSTVSFLLLTGMCAAYAGWRFLRGGRWRAFVPCALSAATIMLVALGLTYVLGYVDASGQLLTFGLNPKSTHRILWITFLSFGPVLIAAIVGVILAVRERTLATLTPVWFVLALCAGFYFFVDLPDSPNSIGWHAAKVGLVGFTPLVGLAFQYAWQRRGWMRATVVPALAIVGVAGVPTVAIDVYNNQDVWNRQRGPAYRWTVLLTPGELEGLEWIKNGTFKSARVQVEPVVRDRDTWAYIPAFAERRMASGFPLSMIPLAKYEKAIAEIKTIYQSTNADEAHDAVVRHCIDYLVVGPPERHTYPQLEALLDADKSRFVPAFRNGTLTVYYVPRVRGQAACQ